MTCVVCGGDLYLESDRGAYRCPHCKPVRLLRDPADDRIGKFHAPERGAPETERRAAVLAYPRSGTQRATVLAAVARSRMEGLTDEEIGERTGIVENAVRPRRVELVEDGWVEDSGRRRPTKTGSDAAVWVLSDQGVAEWRAA